MRDSNGVSRRVVIKLYDNFDGMALAQAVAHTESSFGGAVAIIIH